MSDGTSSKVIGIVSESGWKLDKSEGSNLAKGAEERAKNFNAT